MEVWKDIKGFEGHYRVSNKGRVKSLYKNGAILAACTNKGDYLYVSLRIGKCKSLKRKVHRLVAEAFIENPYNLPQVNHKDENKHNNDVNNLEWCTAQYNINYGNRNKKHACKLSKPIIQYSLNRRIVTRWESLTEAERQTGFSKRNISACCRGKQLTAYGYIWEYDKARMEKKDN